MAGIKAERDHLATILGVRRQLVTRAVCEWVARDEQAGVRAEVLGYAVAGIGEATAARMATIRSIGILCRDQGPGLEIAVRLIEAGVSIVDWEEVYRAAAERRDRPHGPVRDPGPAD